MKTEETVSIQESIRKPIAYPYFKDKYALELLQYLGSSEVNVREVRESSFAGLLEKPLIKSILASKGKLKLGYADLIGRWGGEVHYQTLTTAIWGENEKWRKSGYYQVTRPEPNLVLQINLSSEFDRVFKKHVAAERREEFNCFLHPVSKSRTTLGWSRLDVDLISGEALIEEVQSDWIREFRAFYKNPSERHDAESAKIWKTEKCALDRMKGYLKIWDELILAATIRFIVLELEIRKIWYHTNDSAAHFKMISYSLPPKSLYSRLPKKFGFQETSDYPSFVRDCKYLKHFNRKADRQKIKWFFLNLSGNSTN